jgi:hypothetical protein
VRGRARRYKLVPHRTSDSHRDSRLPEQQRTAPGGQRRRDACGRWRSEAGSPCRPLFDTAKRACLRLTHERSRGHDRWPLASSVWHLDETTAGKRSDPRTKPRGSVTQDFPQGITLALASGKKSGTLEGTVRAPGGGEQ